MCERDAICPMARALLHRTKERGRLPRGARYHGHGTQNPYRSLEYRRYVIHRHHCGLTTARTPGEFLGWTR